MCTLTHTTGKRSGHKGRFKYVIEYLKERVVKNPVHHRRFMNMSSFWVVYVEADIRAMHIGFIFQITMQFKNMLFKIFLKQQNIFFISFSTSKFVPCQEQILWVDNCRK